MGLNLGYRLEAAKTWIEVNPRLFVAGVLTAIGIVALATIFHADLTHFASLNPFFFSVALLGGATFALLGLKKKTQLVALTFLTCLGLGASFLYTPSIGGYTATFVLGFALTYVLKNVKEQTNPVGDIPPMPPKMIPKDVLPVTDVDTTEYP